MARTNEQFLRTREIVRSQQVVGPPDAEAQDELARRVKELQQATKRYDRGKEIYVLGSQRDSSDPIRFIVGGDGLVDLQRIDIDGHVISTCTVGRGGFLGVKNLGSDRDYYDVTAKVLGGDVKTVEIPPEEFREDPHLIRAAVDQLGRRISIVENRTKACRSAPGHRTLPFKVNRALVIFSDTEGLVGLTHQEIAETTGVTRERVSYHLGDLRRAGLVEQEGEGCIRINTARVDELFE